MKIVMIILEFQLLKYSIVFVAFSKIFEPLFFSGFCIIARATMKLFDYSFMEFSITPLL